MCHYFVKKLFSENKRPRFTKEQLLEFLKKSTEELGHTPTIKEMNSLNGYPKALTFMKYFESWNKALEAAGLEINRVRPSLYRKEALIELLKNAKEKLGRVPSKPDMENLSGFPTASTFMDHFGSWNKALEAVGFEINQQAISYSDEELLGLLKKSMEELGHVPTSAEISDLSGYPSSKTFINRFGSWNKALEAAGFEINRQVISYSDEELIGLLKKSMEELGHVPTSAEISDLSGFPTASTFMDHFGSWNKALEAANLETNHRGSKPYSKEELIELLKKKAEELGRIPLIAEIESAEDLPSYETFSRHFGGWNKALKAAMLKK